MSVTVPMAVVMPRMVMCGMIVTRSWASGILSGDSTDMAVIMCVTFITMIMTFMSVCMFMTVLMLFMTVSSGECVAHKGK